jgi:flagellar hook assembly protein FlgD
MKRKWDGKNEKGEYVASGVYVVYAQMPAVVKTGRLIVLR